MGLLDKMEEIAGTVAGVEGLKKVDGRELHRVDYLPKKSTDLRIELYFELSLIHI